MRILKKGDQFIGEEIANHIKISKNMKGCFFKKKLRDLRFTLRSQISRIFFEKQILEFRLKQMTEWHNLRFFNSKLST